MKSHYFYRVSGQTAISQFQVITSLQVVIGRARIHPNMKYGHMGTRLNIKGALALQATADWYTVC